MKKKTAIVLLIVTILNLFSITGVPVYADDSEEKRAFALLNMLDIMPANLSSKWEEGLSRAEFAVYAANAVNVDADLNNNDKFYNDVPQDHWALNSINTLTQMGAFTVNEEKRFYPNREITLKEAVKIMLQLAGYGAFCEAKGGYPSGYLSVANERDILDGVALRGTFTVRDVVMLIYNAMNMSVLEPSAVSGESVNYETGTKNLLSIYHDVYFTRAQVTGVFGATITQEAALSDKEVRLGKKIYKTPHTDAVDYLGLFVDAYYKHTDDASEEIIYIEPTKNVNDYMDIVSSEDVSFNETDYTLSYYQDNKRGTQKISFGAIVMKNGKSASSDVKAAMDSIRKGTVRLIDTDRDGVYDIVLINEYVDIVIGHIDTENQIVYDEYDVTLNADLEEEGRKAVLMYNSNGGRITFDTLSVGDVISVFKADNYVKIYHSTQTVKGKIVETASDDDKTTVTIEAQFGGGRAEYTIDKDYINRSGVSPTLGMQATLKMDAFGAVAYIEFAPDDMVYGYLTANSEPKFNKNLQLKILTKMGDMKIFDCCKRVKIDEKTESKTDEMITALKKSKASGDNTIYQLIRYSLDEEGKINAIDTLHSNGGEGTDLLVKTHPFQSRTYSSKSVRFADTALIGTKTLIFGIPTDENLPTASEDDFGVLVSSFFHNNTSYGIEAYKTRIDSGFEDVIIYKGTLIKEIGTSTDMFLISHIVHAMDTDGNYREKVFGNTAGSTLSYYVGDGYSLSSNGFKSGDIVRFKTNQNGEVVDAVYVYQYADGRDPNTNAWIQEENPTVNYWQNGVYKTKSSASNRSTFTVAYANVVSTKDAVLKISRSGGYSMNDVDEVFKMGTSVVIVVYDKEADKNSRISIGSLADLVPGMTAGVNATKAFIRTEETVIRWIVVYR